MKVPVLKVAQKIDYFTNNNYCRTIFCQFSTHQELKTDKLRSSTSSSLGTTATAAATTATSSTNDVDLASEVS